jgi:hypothetical protein
VITEAKGAQSKAGLFVPLLGNNDNHPKEAEAVEALLESKYETAK